MLLSGSPASPDVPRGQNRLPAAFEVPQVREDRIVPTVFGTRKVSPTILAYDGVRRSSIVRITEVETGGGKGGTETEEIANTVGYAVFVTILLALADQMDGLVQWFVDDKLQYDDLGSPVPSAPIVPDGEVAESIFLRTGYPAQGENSSHTGPSQVYLIRGFHLSFPEYQTPSGDPIPYRLFACAYLPSAFVGDNVTTTPNWAATITRREEGLFPLSGDASPNFWHKIGPIDINPANMGVNILTGMFQIAPEKVDLATFDAAQETLFNEGFGLCALIDAESTASALLDEFERHVDAKIFRSVKDGLWKMRLIRDDYGPVANLPELTQDEISDLRLTRKGQQDVLTDIVVSYVPASTWKKRNYRIVNPATTLRSSGSRSTVIDLPWICSDTPFFQAIQRLKRRNFQPLAFVEFRVARNLKHPQTGDDWILEPADVIKLSWLDVLNPDIGFSDLVLRILNVGNRAADADYLEITAVEDMFSVGDINLFAQPDQTDTTGPDLSLTEPSAQTLIVDALREVSRTPAITVFASPPATQFADAFFVKVNDRVKGEYSIVETATLVADYDAADQVDRSAVAFSVQSASAGLEAFTQTEDAFQRLNKIAVLDLGGGVVEVVGIKDLADAGGGVFDVSGVVRGLAGTEVANHFGGARVWFPAEGSSQFRHFAQIGAEPFNETLAVESAPLNLENQGAPTAAGYDYGLTNLKPYAPANPKAVDNGGDAELSWSPRTRHRGWSFALQANIDVGLPFDNAAEYDFVRITHSQDPLFQEDVLPPLKSHTVSGGFVPTRIYTLTPFLNGRAGDAAAVAIP